MDAALLLAALAARAGDRVDLLAGDRRVRARVTGAEPDDGCCPTSSTRWRRSSRRWSRPTGRLLAGRGRARSAGAAPWSCCSPPLEPAAVEEGLLPALAALPAHHRVVLASVADPALAAMAAGARRRDASTTPRRPSGRWPLRRAHGRGAGSAGRRRRRRRPGGPAGRAGRPLPDAQEPRPALSRRRAVSRRPARRRRRRRPRTSPVAPATVRPTGPRRTRRRGTATSADDADADPGPGGQRPTASRTPR